MDTDYVVYRQTNYTFTRAAERQNHKVMALCLQMCMFVFEDFRCFVVSKFAAATFIVIVIVVAVVIVINNDSTSVRVYAHAQRVELFT